MKKWLVGGSSRIGTIQLQFEKAGIFCGAIKAMFQYMKKHLWEMLRIQILINPSLPFVFLLPSRKELLESS